jgi:hypothetical protein
MRKRLDEGYRRDVVPDAAKEGALRTHVTETANFTWRGSSALRRVHTLNERCLELLTHLARSNAEHVSPDTVQCYRALWGNLNPQARSQAAQVPCLLLDVYFKDARWWRWARDPHAVRRHRIPARNSFSRRIAGELMRETLMLAWSTVAFDRAAATILLGMAPDVSAIIAELGVHDVERIAARQSRYLQLRWDDFPAFWSRLLNAAVQGDEDALHACHLHGIQLLGSELLPLLERSR